MEKKKKTFLKLGCGRDGDEYAWPCAPPCLAPLLLAMMRFWRGNEKSFIGPHGVGWGWIWPRPATLRSTPNLLYLKASKASFGNHFLEGRPLREYLGCLANSFKIILAKCWPWQSWKFKTNPNLSTFSKSYFLELIFFSKTTLTYFCNNYSSCLHKARSGY